MMNRIDAKFKELNRNRKKALILFVTAGDPSWAVTRQVLRFCERVGVDVVELGVPFSDPLADGPVIQASSHRALQRGVTLDKILQFVRSERKKGLKIPLVLMSSYNPLFQKGIKNTLVKASRYGVDGLIVPDLPLHEAKPIIGHCHQHGLSLICMTTPTTSKARKVVIAKRSRGFIYYVSLAGVTGERQRSRYPFRQDVLRIKKQASVPVCVGFGISTTGQARTISRFSDGVIVGSALVRHLNEHSKQSLSASSRKFIQSFLKAVKS
jgi:tryptophan synthase alpha chain